MIQSKLLKCCFVRLIQRHSMAQGTISFSIVANAVVVLNTSITTI